MKNTKKILYEQLLKIKPAEKEQEELKNKTKDFIKKLEKSIKAKKIRADVFVGGSLAKGTIIKKEKYDIDIFVRFSKEYEDKEISGILDRVLGKAGLKAKKVHGSRDYFQVKRGKIIFEIIPTIKISKPEQARNVTDLSYFHVNYVKKNIKKRKKLAEDIMLAKSFTHSCGCYGAESYIQGFSGYALELLVIHYKGFLNFVKAVSKADKQIIIDPVRFYKNKQEILLEINESKLQSQIIFVDPTFKQRNALAALSAETFSKFQESCKKFLKNPSARFFEKSEINKKNFNFPLQARTNRQKGDIAGSKLKKFYDFLAKRIEGYFIIKNKEFEYDENKNTGEIYFNLKRKDKLIIEGPPVTSVENLTKFKKKHKKAIIKKGKAWSVEKNKLTEKKFLQDFRKKYKKVIKEMGICEIKIMK